MTLEFDVDNKFNNRNKKKEKERKGSVVMEFTIASRQIIEQKHKL